MNGWLASGSLVLAIALGGCASAPPAPSLQVGQTVQSPVPVGKYRVLLPPGDWMVVAQNDRQWASAEVASVRGQWQGYYLVQRDASGKQLRAAAYVRGLVSSTVGTGWEDSLCERTDVLHRDLLNAKFRSPECLLINHTTNFWRNKPATGDAFDNAIWNWYQTSGLQLPHTALEVMTRVYSSASGFVFVNLWLNPEASGLAPERESNWKASGWNRARIRENPARHAYFEQVRDWALKAAPLHREALNSDHLPVRHLAALP